MSSQQLLRLKSLQNHLFPNQSAPKTVSHSDCNGKNIKAEFEEIFPILEQDIMRELPSDLPQDARDWISKMIRHSLVGGKMNRGLTVVEAFTALSEGRPVQSQDIFRAQVLGWCIEFLQAFFLVSDDIMDQSITRRGQPCWYRVQHPMGEKGDTIGNIAINDSFILESIIYRILDRYFSSESYYPKLVNLFHETSWQTELGQLLDLTSNLPGGKVDLSLFSLDLYKKIVKYKTAYYSFYLPVACAMHLVAITSRPAFDSACDILLQMGEYFQIQDDYLDCYGDPKVIGKIGRDIEENKCSWLIVQALRVCNSEQRKLLEKHYGRDNAEDVKIVKKLYNDLNIPQLFREYEEESFRRLVSAIDNIKMVPKVVFRNLLARIYKRNV